MILLLCFFTYKNTVKEGLTNKTNIVVLGDSILNNSSYVADESILNLLKTKFSGHNLYYFAEDGAKIKDIYAQLKKVPTMADGYCFISVGGNDILQQLRSQMNIKTLMAEYTTMLAAVKKQIPQVYVLDIYVPPSLSQAQKNALLEWNKLLPKPNLLKVSTVLTKPADFVYMIEPSAEGGKKIVDLMGGVLAPP